MSAPKRKDSIRERQSLVRQNIRLARTRWPSELVPCSLSILRRLTREYGFSLAAGEILLLNGGWYVTAGGLLRLARENRCRGILTHPVSKFCDVESRRWVFRASVYESPGSKGFVGYGDADPSNVSPLVRGAEMRVAETRAVNRALRKAYGMGLCSVEELGWPLADDPSRREPRQETTSIKQNGPGNGQPRLRDRLCLLIRQHQLDPTLVKLYAADFCGTQTLREASRDLVESFINNLAEWAAKDRDGLLCHLNGYAQPKETKS